jgi:hypothetical protein
MPHAQRVKFIKTTLKDEPGALLGIMEEFQSKKISLKSLWGFSKQGGDAELVVIGKDAEKIRTLWTSSGRSAEEGDVFFFKGTDKAGALIKSLQALADAHINIKALHAIAVSGRYGSLVWVEPADVENASRALGAK